MSYHVIYDDQCNFCVTAVDILKKLDNESRFDYLPMSDKVVLEQFNVTLASCAEGMYLIDAQNPTRRWQGSDAIEEITRLLPTGDFLINLYHAIPGAKWLGDQVYEQIRDHRYEWFGKRS